MLLTLITGRIKKNKWIRIVKARKTSVSVNPAQELQVDGEPVGKFDQIEIEILAKKVEIITGSHHDQ
jgi:diacylglycerol kinase family enzyme